MGGEIGSGRGREAAARWGGGEMGSGVGIFKKIGCPGGFDGPDERSVGGCILASHWWGSDSVLTRF